MYALRAPRRCQRRPRPLYSRARRAPAAPACFRSIARAETSPRSASPSVSVSVPPAATSRSVVRCLGSFAPDLSPSPASCSDRTGRLRVPRRRRACDEPYRARHIQETYGSLADAGVSVGADGYTGMGDRIDDGTTHAHASLRCVSDTPRGTVGEQGICARAHAGSGARSTDLGKRTPYHWSRNGGGHLPAHHASMFCLFRGAA